MSEPFLAEVRIVGFNFAPRGWALCDGQILPINQNQSLFALLGTTYGGDGRTSFGLPELRGRVPIHVSSGHTLGQKAGAETVTLTAAQMPGHTHSVQGSTNPASTDEPSGKVLGGVASNVYDNTDPPTNQVDFNSDAAERFGGGQAHNNLQPYLVLNFVIALSGLFPSRN